MEIYQIFLFSVYICFNTLNISPTFSHKHESHKASSKNVAESPRKMHNSKMSQDFEHIVEHLKEKINVKKEMSPEELEFHYFMEHDFNNDSRLDGLEILSAIKHSDLAHELDIDTKDLAGEELKIARNKEIDHYTDIIDEIMREDDFNKDGYLSYLEYVFARRRDDIEEAKSKKQKTKT